MSRLPSDDELLFATVKSFTGTFGAVVLDDGRELPFDVSACAHWADGMAIIGARVQIAIDTSRLTGRERAWYVAPLRLHALPDPLPPLAEMLALLHRAGLARELDEQRVAMLVDQLNEGIDDEDDRFAIESPGDLVVVLDAHYLKSEPNLSESDAGATEGWYAIHDYRFGKATDDPLADLSARVGRPLLSLVTWLEDSRARVRDLDGSEWLVSFDARALADLVDEYNDELEERGDPRRFRALAGEDGSRWLLLDEAQAEVLEPLRIVSE